MLSDEYGSVLAMVMVGEARGWEGKGGKVNCDVWDAIS